ncbi:MAG: dockerin type I repeat-containing protein [Oscillospiraceae bacterium]|nr:dockerin type I repeat-containing protein [Oscillospiraceae bacterium]
MKKIIAGIMAVSIMASCALPSVFAEEVLTENEASVSEATTESGYTGTMKEIIGKYEAEGALVFDLARDEGRRNLKTLVIEPDGNVHYFTDESYDIVTMKDGTEPPYEQVNGRYLEKNRVEFVKEEGSNSYRFTPSGNQFEDEMLNVLNKNSNVLSLDEYICVKEHKIDGFTLIIYSIDPLDKDEFLEKYSMLDLEYMKEEDEEDGKAYYFSCKPENWSEDDFNAFKELNNRYDIGNWFAVEPEAGQETGEVTHRNLYTASSDGVFIGWLNKNDVDYEIIEPDIFAFDEVHRSGLVPSFYQPCDRNTSNILECSFDMNHAGEICYLYDELVVSEIKTYDGKKLPVDELNKKLKDAVIVEVEGEYGLISGSITAMLSAAETLASSCSDIKEISALWSWTTADWKFDKITCYLYNTKKTGKLQTPEEVIAICEEIAPVADTSISFVNGDENENCITVTFDEILSSEKGLNEKQILAIEKLMGGCNGITISPEMISDTENRVREYFVPVYNSGIFFTLKGLPQIWDDELVEVRTTDGEKYYTFGDFRQKYSSLSDVPVADGVVPKYYVDNSTVTLRTIDTDEEVCSLKKFVVKHRNNPASHYDSSGSYAGNDEYTIMTPAVALEEPENPVAEAKIMTGDLNSDNKVDITDLSYLSLCLIGDMELNETQKKSADVDGDGEVKLADLAKMRQFLSRKVSSLA